MVNLPLLAAVVTHQAVLTHQAALEVLAVLYVGTRHSACGLRVMTVNTGSMLTAQILSHLVLITLQILTGYATIVCN